MLDRHHTLQHRILPFPKLLDTAIVATVATFIHLDCGFLKDEIRLDIRKTMACLTDICLSTTVVEEKYQLEDDLGHQCS